MLISACLLALAVAAWTFGPAWAQTGDDDHGHADHKPVEKPDEHDEHAGHKHAEGDRDDGHAADHDDHAGHDEDGDDHDDDEHAGHTDELGAVKLTPAQMKKFGIELAAAGAGTISRRIRLPGEIVINTDRAAHIVPAAGGVVQRVPAKVGDVVKKGQVLAVLASAELAEAKTGYQALLNELGCCTIDLTRAKSLHDGTEKLLAQLSKSPTLEQFGKAAWTDLGESQGKLIAAYAELVFARSAYEREKDLHRQGVASRSDFQTAESSYRKAYAEYIALRSSVPFEAKRTWLEARRSRQNTEFQLASAERELHLLGLTAHDVEELREPVTGEACKDPNCPDCKGKKAGAAADEHAHHGTLGEYSLRAPFAGTIIRKHIAVGEKLADDADVFLIADLSSVWVDLSVYQKDLAFVRKSQRVHVEFGAGIGEVEGSISFVSPIVDKATRTCLARVELANPKGVLRPGLFVTAEVAVGQFRAAVLVPVGAVQQIENRSVVFMPTPEGLEAIPVKLGRSSRTHVEIVSGLKAGQKYVAAGAFNLKAKIVTSGLGAHAGHGH